MRKRRRDREIELEEMERLRSEEQRLREAAQYGDWMKKEEDYHIEQMKERSKIRLMERREKPIDLLAKNIILIDAFEAGDKVPSHLSSIPFLLSFLFSPSLMQSAATLSGVRASLSDPVALIQSHHMTVADLDSLIGDIDTYIQLEQLKSSSSNKSSPQKPSGIQSNIVFWQALKEVAAGERKKKRLSEERHGGSSRGPHKAVETDVHRVFANKDAAELKLLSEEIIRGIKDGTKADVEYWEIMAQEALLEAARLTARQCYSELVSRQLDIVAQLRQEANEAEAKDSAAANSEEQTDHRFLDGSETAAGPRVLDDSEVSLRMERMEAEKDFGDSEEKMRTTDEVQLSAKTYAWEDKYRPRKPRYFNRVRSGYDWNKYNATHYDHDNPPPKMVLGYKFNIFYPDLIDSMQTPQYFLEACDEPGFAVLRFHAGPPYEDIAFKLVNQQWDRNPRSGYRCVFERGVLQLHFNFKRHWYRR